MKKGLELVVMLVLLLVAGCSDKYSASIWGDNELGVRVGNIVDANRVEIGFAGIMKDEDLVSVGVYGLRYAGEIQVLNPITGEGYVSGDPYFGIAIDRNIQDNETDFSTIIGVRIEDFIFTETRFGNERQSAVIGLKYDF